MAKITQDKMDQYNEGRSLQLIQPHLDPLLEKQRQSTEAQLIQSFRANATEREIFCHVAKLAVLQDIRSQINQKTQTAMQIAKELANET